MDLLSPRLLTPSHCFCTHVHLPGSHSHSIARCRIKRRMVCGGNAGPPQETGLQRPGFPPARGRPCAGSRTWWSTLFQCVRDRIGRVPRSGECTTVRGCCSVSCMTRRGPKPLPPSLLGAWEVCWRTCPSGARCRTTRVRESREVISRSPSVGLSHGTGAFYQPEALEGAVKGVAPSRIPLVARSHWENRQRPTFV